MKNYTSNLNLKDHINFESGISGHGIIISILSAIVLQMTIYTIMGVTILDVPLMFTILLWFIFAGFIGLLMDYMGI